MIKKKICIKILNFHQITNLKYKYISTGSQNIDNKLKGGIRLRSFTHVYG